jgi:hypothetical protein
MSDRSGLGLVDLSILGSLADHGVRPDRPRTKCATAIWSLDRTLGLAPAYAYGALCDMARPWLLQLPLIDFHGNLGSRGVPDPPMRHCERRLSEIGALAVAAERGEIAPVPVGMINGDSHLLGHQPPFPGDRIIAGLRLLLDHEAADEEVVEVVGPPSFPSGSAVSGDLDDLLAGQWAKLSRTPADGTSQVLDFKLPSSLPTMLRDWGNRWGDEDISTSLDLLNAALDRRQ